MRKLQWLSVIVLLGWGFYVQAYFLTRYPQPILFGDPGAYYVVGQKLQQAFQRWLEGERLGTVYESVRGYLYFLGVGSLYGFIDAWRPKDIGFFRMVLAAFNTLALLGCFLLARRLSGSFGAGLLALAASSVYPSLSVQTGRLFPEPIVGCLFTWATLFYVEGVERSSSRWMLLAGVSLTYGLIVRSQIITYVSVLLALAMLASYPWWRDRRKLGMALAAGALPFVILWFATVRSVGDDLTKISDLGFFYFPKQHRYPYGFWLFLESDGWLGPYQLNQYPFYRELESSTQNDPALATSRGAQYTFVARYLAARPSRALSQLLENVYRLYRRPANDYRWDYTMPLDWQRRYQAVLVVLGLAGFCLVVGRKRGLSGILFLPVALAVLHALSFPLARYAQPVMLIFVAAAAAWGVQAARSLASLRTDRRERVKWRAPTYAAGAALFLRFVAEGIRMSHPTAARLLLLSSDLSAVAAVFLATGAIQAEDRRTRQLAWMAGTLLGILVAVHAWRDKSWHQLEVPVGTDTLAVEQEIHLSGEALARLRRASEAFVVFDIQAPQGTLDGAIAEVNGQVLPGSDLIPTIPPLGESTVAGGRDNRTYPQWWALPLSSDGIPGRAPGVLRVKLQADPERPFTLFADRFSDETRFHDGPSFGDWPHLATLKLEFDGDYRLPRRIPLASAGTRSYVWTRDGGRRPTAYTHRIRILTIENNEGHIAWESGVVPAGKTKKLAVSWFAYSGKRGQAELTVDGQPTLSFPLGSTADFEVSASNARLCHHAEPRRDSTAYGRYVLVLPTAPPGKPLSLALRYRSGMSIEPMFYSLDLKRSSDRSVPLNGCGVEGAVDVKGAANVVDASANSYPRDTGRWKVSEVF